MIWGRSNEKYIGVAILLLDIRGFSPEGLNRIRIKMHKNTYHSLIYMGLP